MYRIVLILTSLNILILVLFGLSAGEQLELNLLYIIVFHSINYIILFTKKDIKNWWTILIINLLITAISVFSHILYYRIRNIGH